MQQIRPADMREIYALRAETYDYFYPDRTKEIDFWAELAGDYGDDILHLMCATGEITMGLAKKGFNIYGVDLTDAMIYEAKNKLEESDLDREKINFVNADARYFNLKRQFDFAFFAAGDFHHFSERKDIDSSLAKTYAHLRPGGAVAIELLKLPGDSFHREEKEFDPQRAPPQGMDLWKTNEVSYHSTSKVMEIKEKLFVENNGEIDSGEYEIQLELFSKREIKNILENVGFENVRHLEHHDFTPYLKEAETWVVVAER